MKKNNNKGFSLVELIIVIAIMAILIGVLAPQYIKYVEKSRLSADKDTLDTFYKACTVASADPEITDTPSGTVAWGTSTSFKSEVQRILGCGTSAPDAYVQKKMKSKYIKGTSSVKAYIDTQNNVKVYGGTGSNMITVPE